LLDQISQPTQCIITLSYLSNLPVLATPSNTSFTTFNVDFVNNTSTFTIGFDSWTISAGGKGCFILYCEQILTVSTVILTIPNITIVSASDAALQTQIDFAINGTIVDTINQMQYVQETVGNITRNIASLQQNLSSIDFNISAEYPFSDFTDLRDQLNNVIQSIGATPPGSASSCSAGPWSSASCFFGQFGTTIITIGVVLAVVILGYVIFVKMGLAKKIAASCKEFGNSDEEIRMTTVRDSF